MTRAAELKPCTLATTRVVPGPRATTVPPESTVATLESSVCQSSAEPTTAAPRRSVTAAMRGSVSPIAYNVSTRGVTTTRLTT